MTALPSYRDYGHGTHLVIHLLNHRIDRASSSTETPCPVMTQAILYRQYILMSSWQHSLLRCPVFHLNKHRISIFIDLLIVLTSRDTWASVQRWSIQPDRDEEGSWRLGTTRLLIETIDMTAHPSYRDYSHDTHLLLHLLNHRIDRASSSFKTPRPVMTQANTDNTSSCNLDSVPYYDVPSSTLTRTGLVYLYLSTCLLYSPVEIHESQLNDDNSTRPDSS